jgi:HSP20 family molecular chaperone IbpA
VITLRGEKRQVTEKRDERFDRSERGSGRFARESPASGQRRRIAVTASIKNGVLAMMMPKTAEARGGAIPIATE